MSFKRSRLPDPLDYYINTACLTFTGKGKWQTAGCPFHGGSDRPRVNISNATFVCMVGCDTKGGDVLAFRMAHAGLGFIEAAKVLGAWVEDGRTAPSRLTHLEDVHMKPTPYERDFAALDEHIAGHPGKSASTMDHPPFVVPGENEHPCFKVLDDWTERDGVTLKSGVHFFNLKHGKKEGDPPTPTQGWVCGPLYIEAVTTGAHGSNYGRQLRFRTSLGIWRTWAMPMELLRADGADLRGEIPKRGALQWILYDVIWCTRNDGSGVRYGIPNLRKAIDLIAERRLLKEGGGV